jgi:hypothetical protein
MKLRFPIHEALNSGAPDYTLCGQGTAVLVNYDNVAIDIKVDGLLVASAVSITAGLGFVGGVTPKGNTVVSASVETGLVLALEINMPELCSTASVEILCSSLNYHTFSNTFTIFNYDIGNNPGVLNGNGAAITYNPDFKIILVPTNVFDGGGEYDVSQECFASLTGWRRPYTNKLYLYKNNSKPSVTEYFKDSVSVGSSGNLVICASELEVIKATSLCNSSDDCGCGEGGSTNTCTTADFLFPLLGKYVPAWSFAINTSTCVPECLIKGIDGEALAVIDFSSISTIFINDIEVNPLGNLELTWELYNTLGGLVATTTYSIPTIAIPLTYDPFDYIFTFAPPDFGDSIVKAVLEDECFLCEKSLTIEVKDSVDIQTINCNEVQICNYNLTTRYVSISKFVSATESTLITDKEELSSCSCFTSTLADGIYIIDIYDSDAISIIGKKIVHLWCTIKECIKQYAIQVICQGCGCEVLKTAYNFNAMMITLYTYFAYIQQLYDYNTLYTSLSLEQVTDFVAIGQFMERFKEYCEECENFDNPCGCE